MQGTPLTRLTKKVTKWTFSNPHYIVVARVDLGAVSDV